MKPRRYAKAQELLSLRNALRLMDGYDWQHLDCEAKLTEQPLYVQWQTHREALLSWWVDHYPGTRPWAWWAFEAPKPRQMVAFGPTRHGALKQYLRGKPLK